MKRGTYSNNTEPTIRLLLIQNNIYLILFKNIYGYLKTILLDRCKKLAAYYCFYQKAYIISGERLNQLKMEFQSVQMIKNGAQNMNFKIQQFPMNHIKYILKSKNMNNKNRLIFIDQNALNRYEYILHKLLAKKSLPNNLSSQDKYSINKHKKTLIITSEVKKKIYSSYLLNPSLNKSINPNQYFQLTYTQLTNKKNTITSHDLSRYYLITYENLKYIESSWFLLQIHNLNSLFIDQAQLLIPIQNQLISSENKTKYLTIFYLIMKNYLLQNEIYLFLSKIPDPNHLIKLLTVLQPKCFSGVRFVNMNDFYDQQNLNKEEKIMNEDFQIWYKRRYRKQNKGIKEIIYLLKNTVIGNLEQRIKHQRNKKNNQINENILNSFKLPSQLLGNYKLTLLQLNNQLIEKFRIMDKKYKRNSPKINLKQILSQIHHNNKSQKFQMISTSLSDYQLNKYNKNYLIQVKQLMLNSKIQLILRELYYNVEICRQRIIVVVDDQRLEKRLKKYFKQMQIQYVDYNLNRIYVKNNCGYNNLILKNSNNLLLNQSKKQNYHLFDSNINIKVCILNRNKIYKQYKQYISNTQKIEKNQSQLSQNKTQDFFTKYFTYLNQYKSQKNYYYEINNCQFQKITTCSSIYYIDTFWNQFQWEKETLLQNILFNVQFSYIKEQFNINSNNNNNNNSNNNNNIHNNNKSDSVNNNDIRNKFNYKVIYKKPQIIQNYFICQGSHQKIILENYLKRKQSLPKQQYYQQKQQNKLQNFIQKLITLENNKFQSIKYEYNNIQHQILQNKQNSIIQFLDIDQQYDKIQQEAKKLKNNKNIIQSQKEQIQLVYLPKYNKPQVKSFKQMLQEKLLNKNIHEIIEQSDDNQEQIIIIKQSQNHKNSKQIKQNHNKLLKNLDNIQEEVINSQQKQKNVTVIRRQQINANIIRKQQKNTEYCIKQIKQVITQNQDQRKQLLKKQEKVQQKIKKPKLFKKNNVVIEPQTLKITNDKLNSIKFLNQQLKQIQKIQQKENNIIEPIIQSNNFLSLIINPIENENIFLQMKIDSNILQNNNQTNTIEKDLFDELIGQKYFDNDFDYYQSQNMSYYKKSNNIKNQDQMWEVQTQSQQLPCLQQSFKNLNNYFIATQNNQFIKNNQFYSHQIKNTPISNIINNQIQQPQNIQKTLQKYSSKSKNIQDQIQIFQENQVIDLENQIQTPKHYKKLNSRHQHSPILKYRKILNRNIKYRNTTQIYQNLLNSPANDLNLKKRKYRKKQYEEAINKSKQLWQKKLKKQTQTLILTQKRLQMKLKPKYNWKSQLTQTDILKLREKGIYI